MRTLTSILTATLLGLSSAAFAATPATPAPTTRDARMADAMKNYQSQKAGASAQSGVKAAPVATKRPAAKKHAAKIHVAKKHHARAHKARAASVKAAPAAVK